MQNNVNKIKIYENVNLKNIKSYKIVEFGKKNL